MDLQAKRTALETELAQVIALRDRSLRAADTASLQIARIEGALGLVKELQEAPDGQS